METLLGILGKIGFNWQIAVANLFNFLIILFVLNRYAFKPIGKIIDERKAKIDKGLEDANLAEAELTLATEKKEVILAQAKQDADKIIAKSQKDGKELVQAAKEKAGLEMTEIISKAKIEAEKAKNRIEEELKKEASMLVALGVKQVMSNYVADGKGEDVIKAMLLGASGNNLTLKK